MHLVVLRLQGDPIWAAWWADFKATCRKSYPNAGAENRAFKNFKENMEQVANINSNNALTYWASGNWCVPQHALCV